MKKNTENIKHNGQGTREIDAVDRRLLTEMV